MTKFSARTQTVASSIKTGNIKIHAIKGVSVCVTKISKMFKFEGTHFILMILSAFFKNVVWLLENNLDVPSTFFFFHFKRQLKIFTSNILPLGEKTFSRIYLTFFSFTISYFLNLLKVTSAVNQ